LRVALAKGATIDRRREPRGERQPEMMAAARAHEERPLEERAVVDLAAARARFPGVVAALHHPAPAAAASRMARRSVPRNVATRSAAPSRPPSSTSRASALPTITASAKRAIHAACSGALTPKPTPTG